MKTWKLATWNVNSIRARLPVLLDWLGRVKPDVICLQETKVQDGSFPEDEIRRAGYHFAFRGQKSYNGVATLSLSPPAGVKAGLGDGPGDDPARIISAVIDGVTVINAYVPQGRDVESEHFQYKLKWFGRVLADLKKNHSPKDLLILTGDLNIAPEPMDVHDPRRLLGHVDFHPEVQIKLREVMAWGLVDVFRKHKPGPGEYSFFDYRVKGALERGLGWRIDHILATRSLALRSCDAWIDTEPRRAPKPSDHVPVVAEFEIE